MPEADKEEVRTFLRQFRRTASSSGIIIVDTEKTDRTLLHLGITRRLCREEIIGLSVLDYCSGPQPDLDKPGYVWVFSKTISGNAIYIKLKIVEGRQRDQALCLSFHVADKPLDHPFKP